MVIVMEFLKTNLLLGDALKRLKDIPNESVKLIISSPPYNIGKVYEKNTQYSLDEYFLLQKKVLK